MILWALWLSVLINAIALFGGIITVSEEGGVFNFLATSALAVAVIFGTFELLHI